LDPRKITIPYLENNYEKYGLSWKNTGRKSDDWKVKLLEIESKSLQLAIYDRNETVIRLEHYDIELPGVKKLIRCAKSDALNAQFSNFKNNAGICVEVEDISALERLLNYYIWNDVQITSLDEILESFEHRISLSKITPAKERRERLKNAPNKPKKITVTTTAFVRNADVVIEVLERAKGICESCKSPAPFNKVTNGQPYLEVHHIVRLADDTIDNSIALCPNCHREKHYG